MVPMKETRAYENALKGVTIHVNPEYKTNEVMLECEVKFMTTMPIGSPNQLTDFDALDTARKMIAMNTVRDILRICGISDEDLYNLERIRHDQYSEC